MSPTKKEKLLRGINRPADQFEFEEDSGNLFLSKTKRFVQESAVWYL
jgi:hypothetical protein